LIILFLFSSIGFTQTKERTINFPKLEEKVDEMPPKENVWIFLMAGQSNMAGRGFVEPQDTIPNYRVVTINKDNEWIYAKEPIHFYEPDLAGLDCGLSFGNELTKHTREHIVIAIIPCAVGGSSVN